MTKVIMWEAFVQESSDYGFNIKTAGEEENNFFFVMLQHKQCQFSSNTHKISPVSRRKKSKKFFSNELSEHRQNFNRKKVVFKAKLLWNFKFRKFHKNHKMIYSRDMYPKKFSTGSGTGSCCWIVHINLKK